MERVRIGRRSARRQGGMKSQWAILCFLWGNPKFRAQYGIKNVQILLSMVRRNVRVPFTFYCATDDWRKAERELTGGVKVLQLDPAKLGIDPVGTWPGLSMFDPEIQDQIREPNILKLDLDCVITRPIDYLLPRIEAGKITGWLDPSHKILNPSFTLIENGFGRELWRDVFEKRELLNRMIGSGDADKYGWDQLWINHNLPEQKKKFLSEEDGLYHRRDIDKRLPVTARVVYFNSSWKPWHDKMKLRYPWIKEHYK